MKINKTDCLENMIKTKTYIYFFVKNKILIFSLKYRVHSLRYYVFIINRYALKILFDFFLQLHFVTNGRMEVDPCVILNILNSSKNKQ
jgi:hypothetical protein